MKTSNEKRCSTKLVLAKLKISEQNIIIFANIVYKRIETHSFSKCYVITCTGSKAMCALFFTHVVKFYRTEDEFGIFFPCACVNVVVVIIFSGVFFSSLGVIFEHKKHVHFQRQAITLISMMFVIQIKETQMVSEVPSIVDNM